MQDSNFLVLKYIVLLSFDVSKWEYESLFLQKQKVPMQTKFTILYHGLMKAVQCLSSRYWMLPWQMGPKHRDNSYLLCTCFLTNPRKVLKVSTFVFVCFHLPPLVATGIRSWWFP
jgi:hypothetical protein